MNLIHIFIGFIILGISDLSLTYIKQNNAKKCNYDCKNCKNWDCFKLYCDNKRRK